MPFFHFRFPVLALTLLLAACQKEEATPIPTTQNLPEHLTLGNPSGAATDPAQPTNYLLSKPPIRPELPPRPRHPQLGKLAPELRLARQRRPPR